MFSENSRIDNHFSKLANLKGRFGTLQYNLSLENVESDEKQLMNAEAKVILNEIRELWRKVKTKGQIFGFSRKY
jgi:hypothetical protein